MSLVLTDIAVQRQVLLERFKAAGVRKFTATLRAVDTEIRRQLSGGKLTDFRRARLETQLAALKQVLKGHYQEYTDLLSRDLQALAIDSANFETGTLTAFAPTGVSIASPAAGQLWSAVMTNPLTMTGANGGVILESFMEAWTEGDAELVTNAVRMGYALGETNDQILARIRGNAALNFSDGVLATNRAHAETVTRTAVQHVANAARAEVWAANDDIIEEYQWVSTLDSRTTTLCRDRDGKKFPVGKGPLPPAHPNCRSTTVAVLGGEFGRLLDEESERASINGPVPAGETYYDWLKRQPPGFQDQALGPTRGKLFRDGGLSVEEFSRLNLGRNFEPLSLAEMRKLEPEAFARAGISGSPAGRPPAAFSTLTPQQAIQRWSSKDGLTPRVPEPVGAALARYADDADSTRNYVAINAALRNGVGSSEVLEDIGVISRYLDGDAAALSANLSMFRGVSKAELSKLGKVLADDGSWLDDAEQLREALVGKSFDYSTFMSMTPNPVIARNFAIKGTAESRAPVFVLKAESGSRGYASMRGFTSSKNEAEIIRRGGRFEVVGVIEDEFGHIFIEIVEAP